MTSVYEQVRERILSSLSSGTVPWRQTWQSLSPRNVITRRPYRGINRILLSGYPWWGTYRQIQQLGGHVRKGEKAAGLVVFWSFEELRTEVNDQGEEVTVLAQRDRPLVRCYPVFHRGQCEGIAVEPAGEVQPIASCEEIVIRNGPRMVTGEPAYHPARDLISMPGRDRFTGAEAYYATLFHELTHWTGHTSRLNRPGVAEPHRFGTEQYSREELTAEMGAAFLCALTGTDLPVLENQAAYIAGWLRHIQNGSAADVIRAAVDAQRAADYLTGGGEDPSPSSRGPADGRDSSLAGSRQRLALLFSVSRGVSDAATRSLTLASWRLPWARRSHRSFGALLAAVPCRVIVNTDNFYETFLCRLVSVRSI